MRTLEWPVDTRWSDLDMQGHVNNTVYGEYFMNARIDFTSSIRHLEQDHGISWVVVQANYTYKKPAGFPASLKVVSTVDKVGTKSMTYWHRLVGRDDGELFCEAYVTMVAVDLATDAAAVIPEDIKAWFSAD